jgi:hypothetical protein
MKRGLILAAAGVLLAANAWALFSVSRNRREAPGGTVDLTEHELSLRRESSESTALFLEIEWDTAATQPGRRGAPPWLDAAKLTELGFNCPASPADSRGVEQDRSLPSRPVFLVLEYQADAGLSGRNDRPRKTRLLAVDAGLNPRQLRQKHPDTARQIIARGLVRAALGEQNGSAANPLPPSRWEGWIAELLPSRIFVPQPHSAVLAALPPRSGSDRAGAIPEPRYTVTVSWGQNYEPWIIGIRTSGKR